MSRPSCIAFLAVAFTLVGYAVAEDSVRMLPLRQRGAPAHLFATTHGSSDLLTSARLRNDSGEAIASYRIGWAYVYPNEIEFHVGVPVNVPAGLKVGTIHNVPDQSIPFNAHANRIIFFVAEVTFVDGSRWNASNGDIEHEYESLSHKIFDEYAESWRKIAISLIDPQKGSSDA